MKVFALVLVLVSGCIQAQFHSKTGQAFPPLAQQAVIVDDAEAPAVYAAGATVIGTISTAGLATNTTEDLTDRAAQVAAAHGGTHVLLGETGELTYTQDHPATLTKSCARDDDGFSCEKTYSPATTTTSSRPTARYTVLRVPPERWNQLPNALRPSAAQASR